MGVVEGDWADFDRIGSADRLGCQGSSIWSLMGTLPISTGVKGRPMDCDPCCTAAAYPAAGGGDLLADRWIDQHRARISRVVLLPYLVLYSAFDAAVGLLGRAPDAVLSPPGGSLEDSLGDSHRRYG